MVPQTNLRKGKGLNGKVSANRVSWQGTSRVSWVSVSALHRLCETLAKALHLSGPFTNEGVRLVPSHSWYMSLCSFPMWHVINEVLSR